MDQTLFAQSVVQTLQANIGNRITSELIIGLNAVIMRHALTAIEAAEKAMAEKAMADLPLATGDQAAAPAPAETPQPPAPVETPQPSQPVEDTSGLAAPMSLVAPGAAKE